MAPIARQCQPSRAGKKHLQVICIFVLTPTAHCPLFLFCHSLALEDRRPSADDLKLAVKLAIAPRGIFMQQPPDDDEEMLVRLCT